MTIEESAIIKALKAEDVYGIRVSAGDKWLVWADEWVVYQHILYKGSVAIYRGDSESDAVEVLLNV